MITSGFINRYGYPSSNNNKSRILERPYTHEFDKPALIASDPHGIENGRPKYSIPSSVNYQKVFGKRMNADDRLYYLAKGLNKRKLLNSSLGKNVVGRNLFGEYSEILKNSKFDSVDENVNLADPINFDTTSEMLRRQLKNFYQWRDSSNRSSNRSLSRRSSLLSSTGSFMNVDVNQREEDAVNDLILGLGLDLDLYENMVFESETPDQQMIPVVPEVEDPQVNSGQELENSSAQNMRESLYETNNSTASNVQSETLNEKIIEAVDNKLKRRSSEISEIIRPGKKISPDYKDLKRKGSEIIRPGKKISPDYKDLKRKGSEIINNSKYLKLDE